MEKNVKEMKVVNTKLTHVALSIARSSEGKWSLIRIKYNPDTKETGEVSLELMGDRLHAEDAFKMQAVREIFGKTEL